MKTEWKICIVGLVGAALVSTPTWLPVFEIEPEWFGSSIIRLVAASAPFLTFVIGVLAGSKFGKSRTDKPRKPTQEEVKAKNDRVAEENKKTVIGFPLELKAMMTCAVKNGAVYCRTDDWNRLYGDELRLYENFFISENVEGSRTRLIASGALTELHGYAGEVFDVVSDGTMLDHAVYDPSESKSYCRHSSGNRLDWWWYSHDPEKDYRKQFEQERAIPSGRPGVHNIFDPTDAEDELKIKMMKGFSRQKARAILKAYEAEEFVSVGDFELTVLGSIQSHEGIFLMEAFSWQGVSRTGSNYGLTDEWRAFLRNDESRKRLEVVAEQQ